MIVDAQENNKNAAPLRLDEFVLLPLTTREQEASERAQARADAQRYGDRLQAALRNDIPWRQRLNDPAVHAMVGDFNPKAVGGSRGHSRGNGKQ